jgi:hypothetical protein
VTAANGTGTTTATVTIEVAAAPVGSTFTTWKGEANTTPELVAKYAIGGASGPNAQGEAPTVGRGLDGFDHYTYIEAWVRTDDLNGLTIIGESSTNLSAGFSSSGDWRVEGALEGVSQMNPPSSSGCEKKKFIYRHGMAQEKMFLRLRATLTP